MPLITIYGHQKFIINYILHVSRYIDESSLNLIVNEIVDKNSIFQNYFSPDFGKSYKKALFLNFFTLLKKILNHLI